MDITKGKRMYEHLPRKEYFKKNQELAENLWEEESLPTVADIARFAKGEESPKVQKVFDFFDNEEDFVRMVTKSDRKYSQDESSAFVSKVIASNSKEISESGYLYKLIQAAGDDFRITADSCQSTGQEFIILLDGSQLENEDEDGNITTLPLKDEHGRIIIRNDNDFNFYIKDLFVTEVNENVICHPDEFFDKYGENFKGQVIHALNPISCDLHTCRTVCRKCCGVIPEGVENIGTFTCLCVTEFATQAALSSMNKGLKKNINQLLQNGYSGGENWDEIEDWIHDNLTMLNNGPVEARYYQMVYMTRVRFDESTGNPFVTSLRASINHSGNLFGAFIFSPTDRNFTKMLEKKDFNDDSIKMRIAMNNYGLENKDE